MIPSLRFGAIVKFKFNLPPAENLPPEFRTDDPQQLYKLKHLIRKDAIAALTEQGRVNYHLLPDIADEFTRLRDAGKLPAEDVVVMIDDDPDSDDVKPGNDAARYWEETSKFWQDEHRKVREAGLPRGFFTKGFDARRRAIEAQYKNAAQEIEVNVKDIRRELLRSRDEDDRYRMLFEIPAFNAQSFASDWTEYWQSPRKPEE